MGSCNRQRKFRPRVQRYAAEALVEVGMVAVVAVVRTPLSLCSLLRLAHVLRMGARLPCTPLPRPQECQPHISMFRASKLVHWICGGDHVEMATGVAGFPCGSYRRRKGRGQGENTRTLQRISRQKLSPPECCSSPREEGAGSSLDGGSHRDGDKD
jgi:hypothetical protein